MEEVEEGEVDGGIGCVICVDFDVEGLRIFDVEGLRIFEF